MPCGTDLGELIDERRSWRPSMHAGHWSRWLPVEAGYHQGFSGGDRRGNTESIRFTIRSVRHRAHPRGRSSAGDWRWKVFRQPPRQLCRPCPPGGWDLAMHEAWGMGRPMQTRAGQPCTARRGPFQSEPVGSAGLTGHKATTVTLRKVLSYMLLARHASQRPLFGVV
jgi:hypothetical protein